MNDKPNFLYIMVDQQRADWLGCYGHPVVRTPNIDALAARGARFDECHVAMPVCMPNRASFMTGRMPTVHGLRYNGANLSERANTFVDVLRAGGYATATIGKSHLQPFTDFPAERAALGPNAPIEEAWDTLPGDYAKEEAGRYQDDGRYDFPTPYYGFDHVDMVTGHGTRAGGHYRQWLHKAYPNWKELLDPANELPHDYTCPQAFRTPLPEDAYPTAYVRESAKSYVEEQADQDNPFFAFVSFADPHHPFNPPGKYWDMYDPDDFEVPLKYEDHQNPPPPLQAVHRTYHELGGENIPQNCFYATERHIREAMALTAGMITMIDDAVGEIVQMLKDTGQYDNTVIVFNSDHGEYLGDFNMLLKGAWPLRSINRVPMIWSDPRDRAGSTNDALVSTIDISASILDRAGFSPYYGMQGRSFLACMEKPESTHRDSLMIEFNDGLTRMGFDSPARIRTVVTPEWQMSVYKGLDWGELYDRQADPQQTQNLWDSADHREVRADLFETLTAHLMDQMDESPRAVRMA